MSRDATSMPRIEPVLADVDAVRSACLRVRSEFQRLQQEIGRAVVGQRRVVDETLVALFAGGHVLLEGVPGLGKTVWWTVGGVPVVRPHPVHAGSDAGRHHRYQRHGDRCRHRSSGDGVPFRSDLRATAAGRRDQPPHPSRSRPCWKPCRRARCPVEVKPDRCPSRSSSWRRRTPSSRRGPIRCPKCNGSVHAEDQRAAADATGSQHHSGPDDVIRTPRLRTAPMRPSSGRPQGLVRQLIVARIDTSCGSSVDASPPQRRAGVGPWRSNAGSSRCERRGGRRLIGAAKVVALMAGRYSVSMNDVRRWPTCLRHRIVTSWEARAEQVDADAIIGDPRACRWRRCSA